MQKLLIVLQFLPGILYNIPYYPNNECILFDWDFLCNSLDLNNQNPIIASVLRASNLAWENNIATWYSSILLLIIAILSMFCFLSDRARV